MLTIGVYLIAIVRVSDIHRFVLFFLGLYGYELHQKYLGFVL